jgi:dTDP-4-amino-4,6-dideoxygalactose transaminase
LHITDREVRAVTDALRGEAHSHGPWTRKFETAV